MAVLPWFRMYHEARNDRKLATLSDHEFRVWFNLLCLAAEQDERGTIPPMDDHQLAVEVGAADAEDLLAILDRLTRLRIVAGDVTPCNAPETPGGVTFVHFEARNHDKPSDLPDRVAERVRRHRQNQRNVTPFQAHETPVKRDVTPGNALDRDRDIERDTTPPPPTPTSSGQTTYPHEASAANGKPKQNGTSADPGYLALLGDRWLKVTADFSRLNPEYGSAWLERCLGRSPPGLDLNQLLKGLELGYLRIQQALATASAEFPIRNPRGFGEKKVIEALNEVSGGPSG